MNLLLILQNLTIYPFIVLGFQNDFLAAPDIRKETFKAYKGAARCSWKTEPGLTILEVEFWNKHLTETHGIE